MCVSRGKKWFIFRKIWHALFSCQLRFEIRPFALLPTYYTWITPFYCPYSITVGKNWLTYVSESSRKISVFVQNLFKISQARSMLAPLLLIFFHRIFTLVKVKSKLNRTKRFYFHLYLEKFSSHFVKKIHLRWQLNSSLNFVHNIKRI